MQSKAEKEDEYEENIHHNYHLSDGDDDSEEYKLSDKAGVPSYDKVLLFFALQNAASPTSA